MYQDLQNCRVYGVVFCNGLRERIVQESGGLSELLRIFDCLIDASALMKPWECGRYTDYIETTNSYVVKDLEQFRAIILEKKLTHVLIIGLAGSVAITEIARLIQNAGIKWGYLENRGDYAKSFDLYNSKNSNLNRFFKKTLGVIKNNIKYLGVRPGFVLTNTTRDGVLCGLGSRPKIFYVNYRDYYCKSNKKLEEDIPYFIFLDQALPFHFSIFGKNLKEDAGFYDQTLAREYVELLVSYLNSLSAETGLRPIMCFHPNSPEWYEKMFPSNIKVVKYQTGDLAQNAKFMVSHFSNSLSYSYIFKKKVILLDIPGRIPEEVQKLIYARSKSEGFPVQVWPSEELYNGEFPAKLSIIREYLIPNPRSNNLTESIESALSDL